MKLHALHAHTSARRALIAQIRGSRSIELRRIPSPSFAAALVIGFLTALTMVVFRQQLFDHWTFPWDFLGPHSTQPAFVAAAIGSGHIPAWSPFVASGFPVAVDPQVGTYFPGWWLLGAFGVPATLRVLTTFQVAHVLLGSLGVLALARARGLGLRWAGVAAVAYLFFGGFYGEAEHADITRGFAYLPWLLWALTPPRGATASWNRLIALPPLAWITASGAYPGEVVSFGIVGVIYVIFALRGGGREAWRAHRTALMMATIAAAAVCLAVLLPYLRAEQAGELYRVHEPTVVVRAGESIAPIDLLGLYLNNFAWVYDGTVTAWAIGLPVIIGLACVKLQTFRRHVPLAACGVAALALAMTPKIGVIGRAMVTMRPLFPSRFPAADYKAAAAVAMVVIAADAWSALPAYRGSLRWRAAASAAAVGCALLTGALLAPSTYAQPTRAVWLVVAMIIGCVALVLLRPSARVLAYVLVALIAVDGTRMIYDYRFRGQVSPWRVSPAEAAPYKARDRYVRELPKLLAQAPVTRPARIPASASLSAAPTGTDFDNAGWVADGYHFADYDSTVERARWQVEHSPRWTAMMLEPWHGYTFPCTAVGCRNRGVDLPAPSTWHVSTQVRTVSYGAERIVYAIDVSQPTLMVENELAVTGWVADTRRVRPVKAGVPLRAWRLAPGRYEFATTYQQPGAAVQELAAAVALLMWVGSGLLVLRRRRASMRTGAGRASTHVERQGSHVPM